MRYEDYRRPKINHIKSPEELADDDASFYIRVVSIIILLAGLGVTVYYSWD